METAVKPKPYRPGRPLGMANLSEKTKASIVAAKNLQVFSHQRIAQDHNVSRQTVVNTTEEKLSPEAKAHLKSFTEKLGDCRELIANRIHEKLVNNDFKDGVYPNLLNAVNTNYRLESGQSTANIAVQSVAISVNQSIEQAIDLHQAKPDKYEMPTREMAIEAYESACRASGIEPDYAELDLSAFEETLP